MSFRSPTGGGNLPQAARSSIHPPPLVMPSMSQRPSRALDGDGVLLDYNLAYAKAWERATGRYPSERDIEACWAIGRWDVERLSGENLEQFRACFDVDFWSTTPPLASAVESG